MAPSEESKVLENLYSAIGASFPQDNNYFLERALYEHIHAAATECPGVSYEDTVVPNGGPSCKWIRPDGASAKHAMLYMHGGGFSFGSPQGHRKMTSHLAKACGCMALSVDYRLTPEHPFPAAIDDCVAAYGFLLKDCGIKPENVVFCGDSAGGGLVTSVPLACLQRSLPVPACSVALSPWSDLTRSEGGTMVTNAKTDVVSSPPFVRLMIKRYIGDNASLAKDPLVSPLLASTSDTAKLPPHWISGCGHDVILDHAEQLAEKLKKQGVEVVLEVHPGMQHVVEFMAGTAPEANGSIKRIGEWVRRKIGS